MARPSPLISFALGWLLVSCSTNQLISQSIRASSAYWMLSLFLGITVAVVDRLDFKMRHGNKLHKRVKVTQYETTENVSSHDTKKYFHSTLLLTFGKRKIMRTTKIRRSQWASCIVFIAVFPCFRSDTGCRGRFWHLGSCNRRYVWCSRPAPLRLLTPMHRLLGIIGLEDWLRLAL